MTEPVEAPQAQGQSPVDRARRARFVKSIVWFCLIVSGLLVLAQGFGVLLAATLVEMYVEALLGLASVVALAYIGGSVVDYNGGFGNMFSRRNQYQQYDVYDGDAAPRG